MYQEKRKKCVSGWVIWIGLLRESRWRQAAAILLPFLCPSWNCSAFKFPYRSLLLLWLHNLHCGIVVEPVVHNPKYSFSLCLPNQIYKLSVFFLDAFVPSSGRSELLSGEAFDALLEIQKLYDEVPRWESIRNNIYMCEQVMMMSGSG